MGLFRQELRACGAWRFIDCYETQSDGPLLLLRFENEEDGLLLIGRMLCPRATQDTFATVRSTMALKLEAEGWITIVTKSTR